MWHMNIDLNNSFAISNSRQIFIHFIENLLFHFQISFCIIFSTFVNLKDFNEKCNYVQIWLTNIVFHYTLAILIVFLQAFVIKLKQIDGKDFKQKLNDCRKNKAWHAT